MFCVFEVFVGWKIVDTIEIEHLFHFFFVQVSMKGIYISAGVFSFFSNIVNTVSQ